MLCFCVFLQSCRRPQTTLCHALVIITLLFPVYSGQLSLPPGRAPAKRPSKLSQLLTPQHVAGRWSHNSLLVAREPKGVVRSPAAHNEDVENLTADAHQGSTPDNGMRRKMEMLVTPKIDEFLERKKLPFTQNTSLGRQKFSASSRRSLTFSNNMQNRISAPLHPYPQHADRDGKTPNSLQTVPVREMSPKTYAQTPTRDWEHMETLIDFDTLAGSVSQTDNERVKETMFFTEPIAASASLKTRMRRSTSKKGSTSEDLEAEVSSRFSKSSLRSSISSKASQPPSRPAFEVGAMLVAEGMSNFSTELEVNVSALGNDTWSKKRNCTEWKGGQYTMYQIGNLMCLVAFVVPHNFRASGVLMRSSLVGAMMLFSAWASVKLCALDMLLWYVALTAVNFVHAFRLGYVLWPARITPELKDVYDKLFRPLKVPRVPFMQLAREGKIERVCVGHVYAEEDSTPAGGRLAIVLSGRLSVSCDSTHLHYIFPNQFVDSPEWETNRHVEELTELFQVTVVCDEDSVLLVWQREQLLSLLAADYSLNAVLHNLVGRDITTKLYSLTEQQEQQRSNSGSMLMPGDRVRPLLRGVTAVGSGGGQGHPPPSHSNQMQLARQILDSAPGSSEQQSSSKKRAANSSGKTQIASDAGGCTAVREVLAAHPRSPELLDQTTPSVINGANQEVQISRDDTQTPHPRNTDHCELAHTNKGSDTVKEPRTGTVQKDGVMRYRDLAEKFN